METGIFVPLGLFFSIAWTIKSIVDARVRHAMVQSNGSPDLVASILQGDEARRRHAALRWGCVLLALGVGFGVVEAFGWDEVRPGVFAVLLIATGIGNLVAWFAARRVD